MTSETTPSTSAGAGPGPASEEGGGRLIDGRALAAEVRAKLKARVEALNGRGRRVRLDAILVHGDAGSAVYARNQAKACRQLGIEHVLHELPHTASADDIAGRILLLGADDAVHAIMLHLPLPGGVDEDRMQSLIEVEKDVEGVNPANIGNVVYGRRGLVPCTAKAAVVMVESTGIELPGSVALCVGASNIVGKPIAVLLMREKATVISTNVHTRDLPSLARTADVLVTATGVAGLVTADWVKPGAVVVDVGISRITDDQGQTRTVGDVDFEAVRPIAGHISPVPGGVGPLTVAMLLENTVDAAEQAAR